VKEMILRIKVVESLLMVAVIFFGISVTSVGLSAAEFNVDITSSGEGDPLEVGMLAYVHYEGRLENGEIFDKSDISGDPFSFVLGAGQVIQGWEIGIQGMKIGEKRTLIIPPELAYGASGAGNIIPPNATLIFNVELVDKIWPPKLNEANPNELVGLKAAGTIIIDIRREEEWKETGIINGAETITAFKANGEIHEDFQQKFFSLIKDRDTPFLLYCRTGNRTGELGNALVNQLGFEKVIHLKNGIVQWKKQGYEVVEYEPKNSISN
jgi:rhodanese-related sulfurtransferase